MRHLRSKTVAIATATIAAGGLMLATAPAASATEVHRVKRGACTGSSTWKLELEKEHGVIEVDFEAHTKRAGKTWRYVVKQNDVVRHRGTTVSERDGDVEVHKRVSDRRGVDTIVVRVKRPASGEVCRAQLRI